MSLTRSSIFKSAVIALSSILAGTPLVQAAVTIDQSPLIIQKPIPPNLVLMLDDSGSMAWDYMPDSATGINSATNGTYYNPNTTYLPPKYANGTNYPNATFPDVRIDGFNTGSASKNIQTYKSPDKNFLYYAKSSNTVGGNNTGNCGNNNKYNCVFRYQDPTNNAEYYIGQSCAGFTTNCTTDGAQQQNVANWFSYYRTRILMAKTGLTLAFSTLDPGFRVGFSSINGSGAAWIKANVDYSTQNSKIIANVEPFGDGSAGTQKANFWTWITQNVNPGNSTPLRLSLQAVGKYYQTPQPWQTSNTDKSEYACRPSYTILTTDGFWNGGNPSSVGNVDGSTQTAITTPSNYQYQPIAPFSDGQSDTLADVAMQYWVTDLQPTINNEVPSTPSDPAYWQHMTTFTMGLGYTPAGITPNTLTQTKIFDWSRTGSPPSGVTSISWPSPASNSINNITDLMHAAVNGHGDFFSAKNPADFVNGIKSALAQIQDRKGAGNAITLSASSTTASADSVYRFIASYYTGQWTGSLTADTSSDATQTYSQAWSANSVFPSAANRNIWTVNRAASTTNTQSPVEFILGIGNALPALDSPELNGLDYYVSSVKQSTTRAAMLNYLRGDNSDTDLRQRKAVLGDVISSTPVYVAAPDKTLFVNATFPGASTYAAFVAAKTNRTPLVYVAANDGMLHAFRVKQGTTNNVLDPNKPAGQEIFAYMPAGVLAQVANSPSGITNLANPQYGIVNGVTGTQAVPHQYFNDGRITTQSVYLDTGDGNGLIWRTILIGTTGRGPAKTVYAMDITNPANFESSTTTANNILWERSAGDAGACTGLITSGCSSYIGQMTGAPVIGQIKVGASNQWAVFIGNGYNSTANKPALLQFDLATGSLNVRATTGASNDGLAEPGLAQPDFKTGISTQAYAGDLNGNVWSFDLSSPTGTVTKIFQAKDANGAVQPITSLVSLDYDSKTSSTWAYFGTGRYLSNADVSSTQVQTWYGLRVATNATTTPLPAVVTASSTRANLTARTILAEVSASNGNFLRATSQASVGDMNGKLGWYLDLSTQAGERVINRTQFIGGLALVTTMIPKVSDPCNTVPSGAVMLVDPFTGGNFTSDIGLGSTSVTINNKNKIVPFNGMVYSVGPAAGVTGSYDKNGKIGLQFNNMSGSPVTLGPITAPGASAGRVSWRELSN